MIDVLQTRDDVDGHRVGVVGQSLGALYAPLAAAGEPRLKGCIANCGPFDWGTVLPKMPKVSQEVFRVRSHSKTIEEAHERGRLLTLEGRSQNIKCPLLVVFGAGDRLISPAEGERLARTASGPAELVVYPEGNHVCFNISYKFRPLTADWMMASPTSWARSQRLVSASWVTKFAGAALAPTSAITPNRSTADLPNSESLAANY